MTDQPWFKFYDKGVPTSLKPYPKFPVYSFWKIRRQVSR